MAHPLLEKLTRKENLTRSEAASLLDYLLGEAVSDAEIAAVLIALAMKGETADELVGFAETMRAHATTIRPGHNPLVDTAGTGGSRAKTFNVSTAAALVMAAAGVAVAKHGNRAVTSATGSSDVLSALGVRVDLPPAQAERLLKEVGFCFLFAPLHHPATARVAQVRRTLGVRTIFNLLGPLTNPAGATRQLVGVSHPAHLALLGQALSLLGTDHAWVVHGEDGLDEITLSGKTRVVEVRPDGMRTFDLDPTAVGYHYEDVRPLRAESASHSAEIIRDVFGGRRRDAARRLIALNAGAGLVVAGRAATLKDGVEQAEATIDSGRAWEMLDTLIARTRIWHDRNEVTQ
ncbi:MAG TPA: anthranilate phosphoribosyltransferase [Blastocatellia bacterium]|nr:anthranilate phosphoribosyltransferase [Blastocatellia bacterium]